MNLRFRLSRLPLSVSIRNERDPTFATHDPFSHGSFRVCWLKPHWFSNLELWQRCCMLVKCRFGLLSLPFDVVINSISNLRLEQCFSCWDGGSCSSRHQLLNRAQSIAVRSVTPLKQRHLQIFVLSLRLFDKILCNFYGRLRFPIALTMQR